ncbi:MAG TPA: hypothetical protein ENO08_03585 [Candidatus Eisenbacteria bacterium]|uniref:M3 family oligoendopeptidase n=1 Tax=Eiseniibacteriota bacterium TaxID=2212470 RepID=A0A7V2AUL8_UNCEI|nr:hypothetical protein [Candidatus Eisenbacteria bacterium]
MDDSITRLEEKLVAEYGEEQRARLRRGMSQVASLWRESDGDAGVFEDFVARNFAGDGESLDEMFGRFERLLTTLYGNMNAIRIEFSRQTDLDIGRVMPFDEIFAAYSPSAHALEDFFENKLAFVVLLNFPLTTLEERIEQGDRWSRRQWAEARLAQIFSKRIPSDVNKALAEAGALSDQYISNYNIWMHHLVADDGERLFPSGMKLLSHWNLRDQIKADYLSGEKALARQRMIQRVMERIVDQTIPGIVIDNPHVDWNPYTNEISEAAAVDTDLPAPNMESISNEREPDRRYEVLLETYRAARMVDPYSPTAPSLIARRFDENREIPEERVREMFESVLASPLMPRIAALIEERLGRPLEPFDIWYNGFKAKGSYDQEMLDEIVRKRYPTAEAFDEGIPAMLEKLGFTGERAAYLADRIVVEPARGSGHASGGEMPGQQARLRTRIGAGGMDYKGFNIAVHEMGHNVEQVFSMNDVDHTMLSGVPNTAFTEAIAFVFQARDLELLGLEVEKDEIAEAYNTLNDFWATAEISAVSLVDMALWHWMYDHPEASPAELREAALRISKDVWNRYYAPIFEVKDATLLGIYSHIIHSFLYLPDYPMGHMIAFQIEEHIKKAGSVGPEVERMTTLGRITPDLWMKQATGSRVGAEALIEAAERALEIIH